MVMASTPSATSRPVIVASSRSVFRLWSGAVRVSVVIPEAAARLRALVICAVVRAPEVWMSQPTGAAVKRPVRIPVAVIRVFGAEV